LVDTFDDSFLSGTGESEKETAESGERDRAIGRLAGIDAWIRADIEKLIQIEENYPIRSWLSDDSAAAGILVLESVREYHRDILKQYSSLFWGRAHGDVCRIFKAELIAVWHRYKKIPWPAGLDKSGFVLEV